MDLQIENLITRLLDERHITVREALLLLKATQPDIQIIEKPIYYPIFDGWRRPFEVTYSTTDNATGNNPQSFQGTTTAG